MVAPRPFSTGQSQVRRISRQFLRFHRKPPQDPFPTLIVSTLSPTPLSKLKRWINLWWPAGIGEDIASDGCIFETGASEIGALVFVGNLALVLGILLAIFFLHVAVVSGAEALWLTKVSKYMICVFFCHRLGGLPCIVTPL